MTTKFFEEYDIHIGGLASEDFLSVQDSVKSIGVKIEAARAGRINKNYVVYTPKAMSLGVKTFIYPFNKHFQKKHNGEAVGVITDVEYTKEFFPRASANFLDIVDRLEKASFESNGRELVKATKDLIKTPEYKDPNYRGLGIANVYGDLYDPNMIYDIRTKNANTGTVSIGGKSKEVYCSICSELAKRDHEHEKGRSYNGELCFYINNDLYLDHCGFVPNPADIDTNTEIVRDAEADYLNMDIITYTVQDSTENSMNLQDLKSKFKDVDSVNQLIRDHFKDEKDQEIALAEYQKSLKSARDTHYLLADGQVLNLRTPVGIALAENIITQFDDADQSKPYLVETLNNAKKSLKITDTDKALEDFLVERRPVKEEVVPKVEPTPENIATEATKELLKDAPTDTTAEVNTTVVADSAKEENDKISEIAEKFAKIIEDKLEVYLNGVAQKVEDSEQSKKTILNSELSKLRIALDADEQVITALKKDYSDALMEQIKILKGGTLSEAFKERLERSNLDELKLTVDILKDEQHTLTTAKEAEKDLQPTTQTEAMQQVADSVQQPEPTTEATTTTEEGQKEQEATTEPETQEVKDSAEDIATWYKGRIAAIGLAKATKEYKSKLKEMGI